MRTLGFTLSLLLAIAMNAQEFQPKVMDFDVQNLQGKIAALTPCAAGTLSCGQTATGRVSVDSCNSNSIYAVGYTYNGTAGQKVTISGRSFDFPATVLLVDTRTGSSGTVLARDDQFVDGATATISNFTLPYTGSYVIFITPLIAVEFGDYTLTLTCENTNGGSCTTTASTACLLDGRFRVSINYINQFANPPAPGTFLGAKLIQGSQNPDVATFGISSAQAIEVVVRIQDARPFGLNRFDVYYGGLTDLEYTVSITDTQKGTSKTYRNPPGTVGGSVDRTTFTAN